MDRQEMIFRNTLIRGTMGMLDDSRMERYDEAMDFLMSVTNSTTEDDIRPLLRGKSVEDLIKINVKMGTFLKQRPSNVDFSKVISSMYEKGGNFKGD
jgi:hypothetical protein